MTLPNDSDVFSQHLSTAENGLLWGTNFSGPISLTCNHHTMSARLALRRTLKTGAPSVRSASSLSALAYKTLNRSSKQPPLPTIDTPNWSVNAAISSILYETPEALPTPRKRHVLNCLVQNEPGVLSRVSGTLAARGFNIDSLVVSNTEVEDLSRMTIVLQGQDSIIEQARRQIEDLVPVWAVLDYTNAPLVKRELLLAKVSLLGPEYFEELLNHHGHMYRATVASTEGGAPGASPTAPQFERKDYHPSNIPRSEALRHKHQHLDAISKLAKQFGGKVCDVSHRNCIVELCAKPERITSFINLLQPFGILEVARSGMSAMTRTPLDNEVEAEQYEDDVVDADNSHLPPG